RLIGRPASAAPATASSSATQRYTRFRRPQNVRDLFTRNAQLGRIPIDGKAGAVVIEPARLAYRRSHTVDLGEAIGDGLHPLPPHLVFLVMVPLHPHLDSGQQSENLFFPDLHGAAVPMMRRATNPGGLQQIFAAEDQARTLRSAQALAAAVAYERGAA